MTKSYIYLLWLSGFLALSSCTSIKDRPTDEPAEPMADIHIHFNWNQQEVISAAEVVDILRQHNVVLAVVSSRPSELALTLSQAGGDRVLALYSPYYKPGIKQTWFRDPMVLEKARVALSSGQYVGLGEMHLVSGMGPRRDNPIVTGLLDLAEEHDLPVLIHTDAASHEYFLAVCSRYPKLRFLWAHAGGILDAQQVDALMAACPNVWVELSARDPWHYGLFTDSDNRLLPGWEAVFNKYPTRFMTGTDPVWNAHQTYRWFEADEGWLHYRLLNDYHRHWMQQLPARVEANIRLHNALRFFGVEQDNAPRP